MYLNLIQIAESFGVSERVVEGWIATKVYPHTPDRGRLLFDRAQVADWATKPGLAAKAGYQPPDAPALGTNLRIGPLLRNGGIWRDVPAADVPAVFERIVTSLPGATPPVRQLLGQRIRARGGVTISPVGGGFALPHPSTRITLGSDSGSVALLLLRVALQPGEPLPDGVPITRLWFFIAPSPRLHLDLLARLSRCLVREPLRGRVVQGASDAEILQAVDTTEAALAAEPTGGEAVTPGSLLLLAFVALGAATVASVRCCAYGSP
jgi:PTS system nitrogen regulatory IIA component